MPPREVSLTQGYVALVDESDYPTVSKHRWCPFKARSGKVYARTFIKVDGVETCVYLHRLLIGDSRGRKIQHLNGNGLDCTRKNLRVGTKSQNLRKSDGSSRFRGVWKKGRGWRSQIATGGAYKFLGVFDNEEKAARAYDRAALEVHGESAQLNFPPEKS